MKIPPRWIGAAGVAIITILAIDVVLLTLKVQRLEAYIQNASVRSTVEPLQPGDVVEGEKIVHSSRVYLWDTP